MDARRLLLLGTDEATRRSILDAARTLGCLCEAVETGDAFRRSYVAGNPSLIVIDMDPEDDSASATLRYLAEQACRVPVLLVTSFDATVLDSIAQLARLRGLRIVDVTGKGEAPAQVRRLVKSASANEGLRLGIRRALARGEISPCYQPIFDLRTSSIVGVEALMRWDHALLGHLPPSSFGRAADDTGMFDELGWHVIGQALKEFFAPARRGWPVFLVVNASPQQITERGFADRLLRAIRAAGGAPERVTLEVTESSSMEHPTRALALFGRLHSAGVRLALDNFGKGYLFLPLLQRMPIDFLKIDQEFVRRAPDSRDARAILATLVGLGRNMGLTVAAEGIDSQACLDIVGRLGVTLGQGSHLDKQVPWERLALPGEWPTEEGWSS
ncbi:MAG TPA: EAL domain-containing response regulator [Planctomycetota bacterium]|nr:EAL domain-containing response regulator [Planctomycetota bacterium]